MSTVIELVSFIILNFTLFRLSVGLLYESPNVKTALFHELDVRRSCWNHDEINLLRARMIMQDLVPKKVPRDMPYLVEYLRGTEEAVVHHSPEGKVRRIMMMALSDVLGGYLQAIAIPMAKEAYYAGNIDYATMSRLYEMLGEMKRRLKTNGGRWSRPADMSKFSVRVTALTLPVENSELACKAMFVTPAENCAPGLSRIAIPYLDHDYRPGAVALPLKSRNLYSLKTAASSHIIVRFYILARQCLSEMPAKDTEVFNYHFIDWLTSKVTPKLYEDAWYPGFGSVMRIVETVNESEVVRHMEPRYMTNDTSLEKALLDSKSCGVIGTLSNLAKYHTSTLLIFMLVLLVILLVLLCCCCWMFRAYKSGYFLSNKSSSGLLNAVLSIYCGLQDKDDDDQQRPPGAQGYYRPAGKAYPAQRLSSRSDTSSTVPDTSSDDEESTASST